MPKKELPLQELAHYLPPDTFEPVMAYLHHYKVHLTIARNRRSVLGDYRHKRGMDHHRISVNGNLNPYAFLITLLHELAHLISFEVHGNRIQAHGREWKDVYGQVLAEFIQKDIFPQDIKEALFRTLRNPGASTCSEEPLQRVLYKYDPRKEGHLLLEEVPEGSLFKTRDGRVFRKGKKRTKRYTCVEVPTLRTYLFSAIYEVQLVEKF